MHLQKKTIDVDGTEFQVCEISIGAVLPILPRLEKPEEQQEAQMEIIEKCLTLNGEALDDEAIKGLSIRAYLQIAEEVMAINGLGDKEGKD